MTLHKTTRLPTGYLQAPPENVKHDHESREVGYDDKAIRLSGLWLTTPPAARPAARSASSSSSGRGAAGDDGRAHAAAALRLLAESGAFSRLSSSGGYSKRYTGELRTRPMLSSSLRARRLRLLAERGAFLCFSGGYSKWQRGGSSVRGCSPSAARFLPFSGGYSKW